jgi:hypothetical protein
LIASLHPVCVGVDIGKISDPAAVCVAEVEQRPTGKYYAGTRVAAHLDRRGQWVPPHDADPVMLSHYSIRYIQRLVLGTSYPDVATYLADLLCSTLLAGRDVRMLIDVTGVGRPVYDSVVKDMGLRKEVQSAAIKPITFVHSDTYNLGKGSLGKAFLVSRMQSLLQNGQVHAPNTEEVRATLEELRVYQIKVSEDGKDTYGAASGKHDDLATVLGLACLEDPYGERVTYSSRIY